MLHRWKDSSQMKKRIFILLSGIFALILLSKLGFAAEAQGETCDSTAKTTITTSGATFHQIVYCGDADLTMKISCTKLAKEVALILPAAAFEAKAGDNLVVKFQLPKKTVSKKVVVVNPVEGGAGDMGISLSLGLSDPLWLALSKPGTDIYALEKESTGWIFIDKRNIKAFTTFKAACLQ